MENSQGYKAKVYQTGEGGEGEEGGGGGEGEAAAKKPLVSEAHIQELTTGNGSVGNSTQWWNAWLVIIQPWVRSPAPEGQERGWAWPVLGVGDAAQLVECPAHTKPRVQS